MYGDNDDNIESTRRQDEWAREKQKKASAMRKIEMEMRRLREELEIANQTIAAYRTQNARLHKAMSTCGVCMIDSGKDGNQNNGNQ